MESSALVSQHCTCTRVHISFVFQAEGLDISQIEREAAEGQEVEPGGGAPQLTSPLPLDLLLAQQETSGRDTPPLFTFQSICLSPCVLESPVGGIIASGLCICITLMRIRIQLSL
jgi:hypothetical protein